MYAMFGCCTMLPNRAQIGPQIRISDKGRHVHDADEPSSVIPMSWSHGDGCRETESCINCKIKWKGTMSYNKHINCLELGTGSQNYKCQKYVIIVLNNAGLTITSKIKQTRSFYVSMFLRYSLFKF